MMADTAQALWTFVHAAGQSSGLATWLWLSALGFTVVAVSYAAHGCAWLIIDIYRWPDFFYRRKIQEPPLDTRMLLRMWKILAIGTITGLAPTSLFLGAGVVAGRVSVDKELPHWTEAAAHFAAFVLLQEMAFYYSHRLLHSPRLYRHFHKIHHEFKQPIALAAGYAHPVEVLLSVGPIFLHPVIVGAHAFTALVWLFVATVSVQMHHSGYRMPWDLGEQPNFHDFHHRPEGFRSNYGVLGLLDRLHGTDKKYREFVRQQKSESKRQR